MLTKPLIFILVFILAVLNFTVSLLPLFLILAPLFFIFHEFFIKAGPDLLFLLLLIVSNGLVGYLIIDSIFGITLRRMRRSCVNFQKATAIANYKEIYESFVWLKKKFGKKDVELYLDPAMHEVNAYAVGSFSGSMVTLTFGLINQMHNKSKTQSEYLDAIRGILGHEMSHLVNQDFLPGMLTNASEAISNKIASIIKLLFVVFAKTLRFVPYLGKPVSRLLIWSYNILSSLVTAFFRFIFMPIYRFLLNYLGRDIEYRCDRDSAYAYSGQKMALALDHLGARGYFSLFSTHPTTRSRIAKTKEVLPESGQIKPGFFGVISNFMALVLIIFTCFYSAQNFDMARLRAIYMNEVYFPTEAKITNYVYNPIAGVKRLFGF